jgi:hypothetical protein
VHEGRGQARVPAQQLEEQRIAQVPARVAREAHRQALRAQLGGQRGQRQARDEPLGAALGQGLVERQVAAVVALAAEVDAVVRDALEVHPRAAGSLAHAEHHVGPVLAHRAREGRRERAAVHGQHGRQQAQPPVGRRPAREGRHQALARVDQLAPEGLEAREQHAQHAHASSRA